MSLKSYHILLDPEKVDILRKSGQEIGFFLRKLMDENPISLTEGAKAEGSAMEKLSEKFKTLEAKVLKMDAEFKDAKNKFDHAYRRIHRAMVAQGLSP